MHLSSIHTASISYRVISHVCIRFRISSRVRDMAVSQHVSLERVGIFLSSSSVFLNEPLNPPLSSHLCIETACLADFIVFSQVKDFLPQEQTTGKKPILGRLFGSVKTDSNKEHFCLIFRVGGIIIHEMN